MGITAFKALYNMSDAWVYLTNLENARSYYCPPARPGQTTRTSLDEWIPWCTSQQDFDNLHYIEMCMKLPNGTSRCYVIWQGNESDGDFVRYSDDGYYHKKAHPVPGVYQIDGDRIIIVKGDYFFEVYKATLASLDPAGKAEDALASLSIATA